MPLPFISNDPVDSPDTVDGAPHDSQTLSPTVNFTFVNLNEAENLIALCHRRISNKEQRHTIRSHVMQRVRQVESAQGKKRSTGREHSKKSGKPKARKKSNDSDSPVSVESNAQAVDSSVTGPDSNRLTLTRSPRQSPRLTLSPAVHYFDPFDTLPTNTLPHQSSQSLLQYCELGFGRQLVLYRANSWVQASILCFLSPSLSRRTSLVRESLGKGWC
jgi:hypothetical protein